MTILDAMHRAYGACLNDTGEEPAQMLLGEQSWFEWRTTILARFSTGTFVPESALNQFRGAMLVVDPTRDHWVQAIPALKYVGSEAARKVFGGDPRMVAIKPPPIPDSPVADVMRSSPIATMEAFRRQGNAIIEASHLKSITPEELDAHARVAGIPSSSVFISHGEPEPRQGPRPLQERIDEALKLVASGYWGQRVGGCELGHIAELVSKKVGVPVVVVPIPRGEDLAVFAAYPLPRIGGE